MKLIGLSIIGADDAVRGTSSFQAINPANGEVLKPEYFRIDRDTVHQAATLAREAFASFSISSGITRAGFLRACAEEIEAIGDALAERAVLETGLPEMRVKGETARTTGQLRLFAALAEEGSWSQSRIDRADPDRSPLPKPDVRSLLRPLGPVAVFGASNFPLAFSVAGGDTASAFAAGCPVIVKAHGSHPGTAELVGRAIQKAVKKCNLHPGVFSMIFGSGREVGKALVAHPDICAVGFTGSRQGGLALMETAATREVPIPVYAEMSSVNPVVVLPGALNERAASLATGMSASVNLGVGQFCTNPGLVLLGMSPEAEIFKETLRGAMETASKGIMLNEGICQAYQAGVNEFFQQSNISTLVGSRSDTGAGCQAGPFLFEVDGSDFLANKEFSRELFGPATVLVRYQDKRELMEIISGLEGQLTGTIHGTEMDIESNKEAIALLESKVGRLIYNGFPTGVEVCHSMVHGGPFPSTSDGRSTSVGTHAIERFCRYVAYQDSPQGQLPPELKDDNPLGIWRLVDGQWTDSKAILAKPLE